MTDKQIIIDDVDVSGCSNLYDIEDCVCIDNGIEEHCKDRNCYYKQLKRKEQECEELKEKYKWYDHYKEQALYNKNLCNEKSEQLEQLKEEKQGLIKDWEEKKNLAYEIACKNEKLKQTLTEIKEIVELLNDRTMVRKDICDRLDLILQKISEVEDGV